MESSCKWCEISPKQNSFTAKDQDHFKLNGFNFSVVLRKQWNQVPPGLSCAIINKEAPMCSLAWQYIHPRLQHFPPNVPHKLCVINLLCSAFSFLAKDKCSRLRIDLTSIVLPWADSKWLPVMLHQIFQLSCRSKCPFNWAAGDVKQERMCKQRVYILQKIINRHLQLCKLQVTLSLTVCFVFNLGQSNKKAVGNLWTTVWLL